jgi:hypothetical protein
MFKVLKEKTYQPTPSKNVFQNKNKERGNMAKE